MSDFDDAVERLTAWVRNYGDAKPKVFIGDVTMVLLAARDCQRLRAERDNQQEAIKLLMDTLERLVDIQNGPPLIRDRLEWNEIMAEASERLMRPESVQFYREAARAAGGGE